MNVFDVFDELNVTGHYTELAMGVANVYITLSRRDKSPVTARKLQMLMFEANAEYLCKYEQELIECNFYASQTGPTIPDINDSLLYIYRLEPVTYRMMHSFWDKNDHPYVVIPWIKDNHHDVEDCIDTVWDRLHNISETDMYSDMCVDGHPYIRIRNSKGYAEIPSELIYDYYSKKYK